MAGLPGRHYETILTTSHTLSFNMLNLIKIWSRGREQGKTGENRESSHRIETGYKPRPGFKLSLTHTHTHTDSVLPVSYWAWSSEYRVSSSVCSTDTLVPSSGLQLPAGPAALRATSATAGRCLRRDKQNR